MKRGLSTRNPAIHPPNSFSSIPEAGLLRYIRTGMSLIEILCTEIIPVKHINRSYTSFLQ